MNILRYPAACRKCGVNRMTLYRWATQPEYKHMHFPKPVTLGANSVGFVEEEIDRLKVHIGEVEDVIRQSRPVGRRLDFLMQEMNREANTLGAKAANININNASVELKVLIEQMREQIQNIE